MVKIKSVLPTLREKKRYLTFEIISKNKINSFESVSKAIWKHVLGFLGSKTTGKAGIWILNDKYNSRKQRGVIRVGHKFVDDLKAALIQIKEINNQEVIVHSLGTSGVLNKAAKCSA